MTVARLTVLVAFLALVLTPLLFRTDRATTEQGGTPLIIVTPHNEQIRFEFKRAFEAWHLAEFGESVDVIWSAPGGTSEIRRMLQAQYAAQLRDGTPLGGNVDLIFGGGEFEHAELKSGVEIIVDGETRQTSITVPVDFPPDVIASMYGGRTHIGTSRLFDEDHYWFGSALSGFGLVFNRDMLERIDVPEPSHWRDLADPDLRGWVALGNPGQSGSVRKSFDTVLQRRGWIDGWRVLRRASANARYFSASSSKIPIDVSAGDAAVGVCIDFYGRYQAQVVRAAGDPDRLAFVDPPGESAIDADPVSMLRGAPNPIVARRFIEFCLSVRGQALWQFPARGESGDPLGGLGPLKYELRRMPIRPEMYDAPYFGCMIDQVQLFELYDRPEAALILNREYWDYLPLLMSAMAIDTHEELKRAWQAIVTHPAYPTMASIVAADEVSDPTLRAMLTLFDALPTVEGPNDAVFNLVNPDHLGAVRQGWLRGGWAEHGLWHAHANPRDVLRVRFTEFFRRNYEEIVRLARDGSRAHAISP